MAALGEQFGRANHQLSEEIRELEAESLKLSEDLAVYLEDDSPLAREQKRNLILTSDTKKFKVYRESTLDPKLEKTRKQIELLKSQIAETGECRN